MSEKIIFHEKMNVEMINEGKLVTRIRKDELHVRPHFYSSIYIKEEKMSDNFHIFNLKIILNLSLLSLPDTLNLAMVWRADEIGLQYDTTERFSD